ncbi:hypothetical protein D6C87_00738 [Aureobasidium pullulans]|uniref:Uncharacterized protein n=1 Tax=Aureobasidium pullulans TaxID=5580 RepID=A0A4S9VBY1_AURPU|nr:hypothetical protein D6D08_09141 [Aureobasidium pullulans]THY78492.1 hypothetical protein D6C94_01438 [Aureobasidium pullulans]THZ48537.1 hypothetical protein D6C87_00738 [Aureobasidium pullulans]TIA85214.1 hypothetical protein D6C76_01126 [Aureobasidium pullulans]
MSIDAGGLAQMTFNGFPSNGLGAPGSGFASRNRGSHNHKRLSVGLPQHINPAESHSDSNPTPRTSRSHLLAGLRTAPKTPAVPASAPYNQIDYHLFLAQRQQQLQQQLAAITAAASTAQLQGLNLNQFQQPMSPQVNAYGQQQQQQQRAQQSPIEVPGQPGLYLVYNPMTGQYQYAVDNNAQSPMSPVSQNQTGFFNVDTPQKQQPVFRAEISPPPTERPTPTGSRSITPPKKTSSPASSLAHVEPLPPPSANAFRRGHKKASSLAINALTGVSDGPKTSSVATFGSARTVFPPTPMTGTFGPGAARAGEHPIRQPRGPPPLEELIALPTSKHEGSKNFATRQRRRALDNLVRAGSFRRAVSGSPRGSPISERELHFQSEEDEPCFRKQSPIGSERNAKRSSKDSLEGLGAGGAVQTPVSEKGDAFDMGSFAKQLPSPIQQGLGRRHMMLGVLSAAEKRKSMF